jgi:hypothetical protein
MSKAAANFVLEGRITAYTAGPVWQAALDGMQSRQSTP